MRPGSCPLSEPFPSSPSSLPSCSSLYVVGGPQANNLVSLQVQCDAIKWEQFSGDVVLDSFNKAYNILNQICRSKYVWIIIMKILILYNII